MRSTERLICLLESVNADAVNNDGGKPGEFLAEVCREAARRLRGYFETARNNEMPLELADHHDGDHGC